MASLDIASYGLVAEFYSVSLTSGSPTTLPQGLVTNRPPVGVVLLDVAFGPGETTTGTSWTTSGGAAVITPTFSAAVTRIGTVAVLYKV
jgi:hypothetical protein